LKFIGWEKFDIDFLKYHKNKVLHYQDVYIKNGGFPETIGKTDSERNIILTNIYNDILSRDISSRFGVSYDVIKKISYHLLSNISNEFSYRSIANSTGFSVETIEKYLGFLKESFMVLTLDFFSYKTKIQFKQNKKVYCIDTGLRNTVSFRFSEDVGRLVENVVFIELKRRGKDVYYWKDKTGKEVDFLIKEFSDILGPLETKPKQDLLLMDEFKEENIDNLDGIIRTRRKRLGLDNPNFNYKSKIEKYLSAPILNISFELVKMLFLKGSI
jgi:predicted AAA+ superfamily ATPase